MKQLGVNTGKLICVENRFWYLMNLEHVSSTNEAATGVAPIIVDKQGRNSIIVILGANLLLNGDDIERAEDIIRQSKIVVCQLEIREETVKKTFELARKHSGIDNWFESILWYEKCRFFFSLVLTILNPAPMSEKLDQDLLKLADVICPNQTEVFDRFCY